MKTSFYCKKCGELENLGYNSFTDESLKSRKLCFDCNFWYNIIRDIHLFYSSDSEQTRFTEEDLMLCKGLKSTLIGIWVFPDYSIYYPNKMKPKGYTGFQGFGGSLFKVEMKDGSIQESNDVWYRGKLPEYFRETITPNVKKQIEFR